MLGPNQHTQHLASQAYDARLEHAARIRLVQQDRADASAPVDRASHRLMTVRRLAAAGIASAVLTAALAMSAGTAFASPSHGAGGGGVHLVR